ncbi:MAG: CDP-alcohol phosphatidyltransferase family protein [archaeon]|nr:CDP-alcohol phosphatidyltransferase family protein [archaeon]
MLGSLRFHTKAFTEAVAKPFASIGFPPTLFTLLGPVLAIIAVFFIIQEKFIFAFIFSFLAVSIDMFDGSVARLQKKDSLFGNYFETMIDKVVEIILFLGTAFLFPLAAIFALAFSLLNSYAKPRVALVIITDNRDWPAFGEHVERMLLLLAGIFLSLFYIEFFGMKIMEISLWLIAIIAFIGSIQRMLFAKKLIKEAEQNGNVLPYLKK